jgi:hypothetical protein
MFGDLRWKLEKTPKNHLRKVEKIRGTKKTPKKEAQQKIEKICRQELKNLSKGLKIEKFIVSGLAQGFISQN